MRVELQIIEALHLIGCNIDQRGFENLAECIPYLHSLTLLDISGTSGSDVLVTLLKLRVLRELQTLGMAHISIEMDDVAALAGFLHSSSNLRELKVGGRGLWHT